MVIISGTTLVVLKGHTRRLDYGSHGHPYQGESSCEDLSGPDVQKLPSLPVQHNVI